MVVQTERNTKKNPVFLLFPLLLSHLFPIIVCQFWGLTWDSLETCLGLTSELLNNLATYKDGNIPNASRTHPEHIPNIKNVISIIKNRGRSCAHISLTPYLYMIPRFFVAVIHGVEVWQCVSLWRMAHFWHIDWQKKFNFKTDKDYDEH